MTKSRNRGRALALVLITGLFLAGCEQETVEGEAAPADLPAPTVGVVVAATTDISPTEEFIGRIEAVNDVSLRARVQGFLEDQLFEEGSTVEENAVLFRIEKATYENEIARLQASVEGARAALTLAELERDRRETLVAREAVAQSQLDEAIAQAAAAQAELDFQLASLEQARLDLSYTDIKAPFSATIGRATYSEGDLVGPESEPLAALVQLDPVYARVNISMRQWLGILRNQDDEANYRPFLRLADGSMYELAGDFAFTEPMVDPTTDTVPARAIFPNPDGLLLPGAFVTVVVRREQPIAKVAIPQGAIQEDQAGSFVMIVAEDGTAQAQRVQLGDQIEAMWIVEEGLEPGQTVIVQGLQKVRAGVVVDPVPVETDADVAS